MLQRFRRIFAFMVDLFVMALTVAIAIGLFQLIANLLSSLSFITALLALLLILSLIPAFVLRDAIMDRSLGKRLFEFHVYDRNTLQIASKKQRIIRNLFFFIYPIDGVIMLVTGRTIGDRAAGTVVLTQAEVGDYRENQPTAEHSSKAVLKALAIAAVGLVAFVGLIQIILHIQRNSEEAQLAYQYLIASESFQELNVDETKIRMNSYRSTSAASHNDSIREMVTIGFIVKSKSFEVVCHKENGAWQICEECTLFD